MVRRRFGEAKHDPFKVRGAPGGFRVRKFNIPVEVYRAHEGYTRAGYFGARACIPRGPIKLNAPGKSTTRCGVGFGSTPSIAVRKALRNMSDPRKAR